LGESGEQLADVLFLPPSAFLPEQVSVMKSRMMYIEQKTDGDRSLQDRGPAVIAEVTFSRTGRTVYYKGKTLHRLRKGGIYGNYVCVEDGNEYWISGVKKDGSNRHWAGGGPVRIEADLEALPLSDS
jgi:hypothetical protein